VAFHELDALERVNEAVQANITPKLYIVGYTDTVGPTPYNDELSRSRAKAIAKYFHDKGFWAEIYYAGMGERAPRVETGDNVDEVRNRRALYLLGVQDPASGGQIPHKWQKLSGARTKPAGFVLPPLPEQWAKYREERRSGTSGGTATAPTDGGLPDGDGGKKPDDAENPPQMPESSGSDAGTPPPVAGEPGASKKGCSIDTTGSAGWWWLALGVPALRRRRRS
jgi:MYXO-CTERM domain-containing protein